MSERAEFLYRLKAGERMTDLAREYGISRKTGYKLVKRFEKMGPKGLFDESRRPHRLARETAASIKELFLEARRQHPQWGAKKLVELVGRDNPGLSVPKASTVGDWLHAAGLTVSRRRRRADSAYGRSALATSLEPNDVWCVDYKGQFRLGNGKYCYPLTITDHFSRFFLACEGFEQISADEARGVFEALFSEQGVPKAILSDNGSPFASKSIFGLSRLSAWWLKLGVRHQRIQPGHPEQNGRHERMHRTLKAETTRPAGTTLLQQQERFDAFRIEFNEKRPHEALGQKYPADLYTPSERQPPTGELEYPLHDDVIRVTRQGHISLHPYTPSGMFLSSALAGERLGVRELDDGRLLLTFATLDLGHFDPKTRRFHPYDAEQPTAQGAALLGPAGPALLADDAAATTKNQTAPTTSGSD